MLRYLAILLTFPLVVAAQGGRGRGGAAIAAPGPCDRACLEDFMNQYLDAVAAHNAFGLPYASKVKFSENAQLLELGDGLWNTATGLGTYKLYVSDPQSGQIGFLGTLRENDTAIAVAARLKVENRRISEIETVVLRGGNPNPASQIEALGKPDALFTETVPESQRSTREAMIQAANKYLDAIESGVDNGIFHRDCDRTGNGTKVTHNPALSMPGLNWNPFTLGCGEQVATRMYSWVKTIYPRRLPIVDEERQLVFSFSTFQVPGDVLSVESPGHGIMKFPENETQPLFMLAPEVFRIQEGKIRRAENLVVNVPYGTLDPFFGDDWRKK
jgi:hypothetical protein